MDDKNAHMVRRPTADGYKTSSWFNGLHRPFQADSLHMAEQRDFGGGMLSPMMMWQARMVCSAQQTCQPAFIASKEDKAPT